MRFKYFHSAKVIEGARTMHFRGKDDNVIEAVMFGNGGKPVMVANHCWAGPSGSVVIPGLSRHYDVLVVANRGMGNSEIRFSTPDTYLLDCAADRATVLKALNIRSFHMLGHSMGGASSVLFAHIFEQFDIRSLTLLAPMLNEPVQTLPSGLLSSAALLLLGRIDRATDAANGVITDEVVRKTTNILHISGAAGRLRTFHRNQRIREVNKEFWKAALCADQHVVATGLQAMRKAGEMVREAFDRLKIPTLVITGQYDTLVDARVADGAAIRNPNARGVIVKGTSHFLHLEKPSEVLSLVLEHAASIG